MPGDHITNMSELYSFFKEVANNNDLYKAERRKISQWANKYSDGNNCERITKLFSI